MRKILALAITLILITVLCAPATAAGFKGAAAKVPYPMGVKNITLQQQKVDITVYSNFIKVEGEYLVKNENKQEVTATFGFPFYRHGKTGLGEYPPIGLEVLKKKKEEDYFVKRSIEGNPESDGPYKEWYLWDVDIAARRNAFFRVIYYLRMDRDKGIPHFTYSQNQSRAYTGAIGQTNIEVNMGLDCKSLPFVASPDFSGRNYLYTSLPSPKIQKNLMFWTFKDHLPLQDLQVYFYKDGYPDWEVSSSNTNPGMSQSVTTLFDGTKKTCWISPDKNNGIGSYLVFQPVIRDTKGDTRAFEPMVKEIGIVPGNTLTLSSFYNYSHVKEGIVEVMVRKQKSPREDKKVKPRPKKVEPPQPRKAESVDMPSHVKPVDLSKERKKKKNRPDVIMIDCLADPVMQFFSAKQPLLTRNGPLKLLVTMVYPGQQFKELCISEVLIFDRDPKTPYEY